MHVAQIDRAHEASLVTEVPGGETGYSSAGGAESSSEAARAALRYATAAARQMLEQGTRTTLRAYRFAKSTAT
jgi:hypothetical protein